MAALIPCIAFPLLFFYFRRRFPAQDNDWRHSFLLAAVVWGSVAVLSAEILSLLRLLSLWGVLSFWLFLDAFLIFCLRPDLKNLSSLGKSFPWPLSLPRFERISLMCISFLVLLVGLVAFKAPPNTWDSMTYHMSRVAHWIQNQTLANYPTPIVRQIIYPPGAEILILHFQILSRGDHWANFIQWFSMVGSLIGVSLIAWQLGASSRGQVMSALIAATIPMGILQASGTQNDYVTAFGLVCFVYFLFRLTGDLKNFSLRNFFPSGMDLAATGLSLGLSILTKATAYFFAFPFLLWFGVMFWKRARPQFLAIILAISLFTGILNLGHWIRSWEISRRLSSPIAETSGAVNKTLTPKAFLSNVTRNIGIHLVTPSVSLNLFLEKLIYDLHRLLEIDITDTNTTYGEHEFHIGETVFHEDYSGNFLHTLMTFVGLGLLLWQKIFYRNPTPISSTGGARPEISLFHYLGLLTVGFLSFSFLLKWAPWHSRLHLPLFVLVSAWLGTVLGLRLNPKIVAALCVIFFLNAMPWAWGNQSRSFLKRRNIFNSPRLEQYFYNKHGYIFSYIQAAEDVKKENCHQIGLSMGPDSWEYPLWVLLDAFRNPQLRLEHVDIRNSFPIQFETYPLGDFGPCAIIDDSLPHTSKITFRHHTYVKTRILPFLNVFKRDETGLLAHQSLLFHLNKSMEYSAQISHMLARHHGALNPLEMERMMRLREEELRHAQQLDVEELNDVFPGLGTHWQQERIIGLTLLTEGYMARDKRKFDEGQFLLLQWETWLKRHQPAITQAFEQYPSRRQ